MGEEAETIAKFPGLCRHRKTTITRAYIDPDLQPNRLVISGHCGRSGASIIFPIAGEAFDVIPDRDGWRATVGERQARRVEAGFVPADNATADQASLIRPPLAG
jgi:hypothetical protein